MNDSEIFTEVHDYCMELLREIIEEEIRINQEVMDYISQHFHEFI